MKIARVIGQLTLSRQLPQLPAGSLLIAQTLDGQALDGLADNAPRASDMSQSLVLLDEYGAGEGQLIALSEGGEATMPYRPKPVVLDAYCAAILDTVEITEKMK